MKVIRPSQKITYKSFQVIISAIIKWLLKNGVFTYIFIIAAF